MVSDVTRMGEWSPENVGGEWLDGATGPKSGAKFRGTNSNGKKKWKTVATVTDCKPGKEFAFTVKGGGLSIAEWRYAFEAAAGGCRVTETWTDHRGGVVKMLGRVISGVADRAAHNRAGMEQTLERLAAKAETDENNSASARRNSGGPNDERDVAHAEASEGLLTIYDRALPQVYGYLLDRCGDVATAEDLTSETFLAAVAAPRPGDVSVPWLIGVARHKLVDHWRRRSRDERLLTEVAAETEVSSTTARVPRRPAADRSRARAAR